VLVGASADAACHFLPTADVPLRDMCNAGGRPPNDYRTLLPALQAAGLDKIRLWVTLGGARDAVNIPFAWDGKVWRLDRKNQEYFDRLRAVVSTAREHGLIVEVTFFAPFTGGDFETGPWSWASNRAVAPDPYPDGPLRRAGFTAPEFFVVGAGNERMRIYQKKIIEWTVEELWCFDNVYWEIANEPEDQKVHPLAVAAWQEEMLAAVAAFDSPARYPRLRRPHLVAVQPFTEAGADRFVRDSRVSILNGHYAQVATGQERTLPDPPGTPSGLDLGALQMTQRYAGAAKVLGFNEGKITPLTGPAAPRRHLNGTVDPEASLEASRAEAWEFLLNQGGILDHWGYVSSQGRPSPLVAEIRRQLSALKDFVNRLPLVRIETAASSSGRPPAWIRDGLPPYPTGTSGWDEAAGSQRYWAALQTDPGAATGRLFLLYSHHSTRRCLNDADFTAAGCPGPFLPLGGYDARVWTPASGKRYTARFSVDLGPRPGLFDVVWRRPADLQPLRRETLAWKQAACELPGCRVCADPQTPCTVGFEDGYDFDILLEITQR
jgi:hypothetical protein